jgi:hypothetical protein
MTSFDWIRMGPPGDTPTTLVIPTIAPRREMLARALASASNQTLPFHWVLIADDVDKRGAPATRHDGLMRVKTPWVAFLDDDDELGETHHEKLHNLAAAEDLDYVFSYFTIPEAPGWDPLNDYANPFDPANPKQTTITILVKTELAQAVGFAPPVEGETIGGQTAGEDYRFTLGCLERGAKIGKLMGERTWLWHHHGGNTSGRADRW